MANYLTYSTFEGGELNISGTEDANVRTKITTFITKYEDEYLLKALGYPLYKLLKADAYPNPVASRFINLMNGAEYEDSNGFTRKFPGLKVAIGNPLANYVWYWFNRDNVSYNTIMGEKKAATENSANASQMLKQSRAWNEMVDFTIQLWKYLDANDDVYTEFDICQTDYNLFRHINSLNL